MRNNKAGKKDVDNTKMYVGLSDRVLEKLTIRAWMNIGDPPDEYPDSYLDIGDPTDPFSYDHVLELEQFFRVISEIIASRLTEDSEHEYFRKLSAPDYEYEDNDSEMDISKIQFVIMYNSGENDSDGPTLDDLSIEQLVTVLGCLVPRQGVQECLERATDTEQYGINEQKSVNELRDEMILSTNNCIESTQLAYRQDWMSDDKYQSELVKLNKKQLFLESLLDDGMARTVDLRLCVRVAMDLRNFIRSCTPQEIRKLAATLIEERQPFCVDKNGKTHIVWKRWRDLFLHIPGEEICYDLYWLTMYEHDYEKKAAYFPWEK